MKKMRLHIFIAMAVFLIMIIVGSFVDLELSKAIFSKNNGFGLTVAALSMNLGYGVIALMGGVILYHALKLAGVTWQKVAFFILALAFYGVAVYFDAGEFFGENGWYGVAHEAVGYALAIPLMGACSFLGYYLGKKANNPQLWLFIVIGAVFIGLSLIIGTTVVKSIFHRPRYRIAIYEAYIEFHPWWKPCKSYKDLIATYDILTKEEFKSFPSGHTSVCALTMMGVVILPFIMGKELKHQVLYFYLALAYTVFVAFTRIMVGAHFLSDVGMGGLISLVCLYIYYEIILHNPALYETTKEFVEEEEKEELELNN